MELNDQKTEKTAYKIFNIIKWPGMRRRQYCILSHGVTFPVTFPDAILNLA